MSWSPTGDRLAYFVRTEKSRTLILQNVLTGDIEQRARHADGGRARSRRTSRPTAEAWRSRRCRAASATSSSSTCRRARSPTSPRTSSPTRARPGRRTASRIVYVARISGNEKLFRLDVDTGQKTQLTFGTHDDAAAQFLDADTLVFSSTATDPAQPIDPDVARNGNIYNIWTLNLKTGELRQYTDALGGNTVAGRAAATARARRASRSSATTRASTSCTRSSGASRSPPPRQPTSARPAPIIDFQAPLLAHAGGRQQASKKGKFEKMFLDGRPPVNVGVTSGGDVFGGTAVTFSDVLGDQQFNCLRGVDLAVPDAVVLVL